MTPGQKGFTYVISLILLGAALFLIGNCADGSAYTMHPEKINKWIAIGIAPVALFFIGWAIKKSYFDK